MFAYIFVFVALFASQSLAQVGMGPLNVNLVGVTKCDGDAGIASLEVVSIGDDQKGLNIDIDLPFPMDETVDYKVRVDKVVNGQIQKGVFTHSGDYACEDFDKFLGTLWKKIVSAMGLGEDCPKPEGHYHVDNFPFDDKDIDIDTFLYGRFLMNMELNHNGEMVVCQVVEFTNNRPGESV